MKQDEMGKIIEQYIAAYNQFDIEGMLALLSDTVIFENYSGGELNLSIKGKDQFRDTAEQSAKLFTYRSQKITDRTLGEEQVIVKIDYHAILAVDLSDSHKAGDELRLSGKTIFRFSNGRLSYIADYS